MRHVRGLRNVDLAEGSEVEVGKHHVPEPLVAGVAKAKAALRGSQ